MLTITKEQAKNALFMGCGVLIVAGIYMRDTMGILISKYILLCIAMIPILFFEVEKCIVFSAFVIPLYVGLPGNYITLILLIRLGYELICEKIKINVMVMLTSLLMFAYLFYTNMIFGNTSIYHIAGTFDFILLALIISVAVKKGIVREVIVAFSIGVAATGLVMLSTTLQYFTLTELMDSSTRLGYTGMLGENVETTMVTTIDPNFYAMNAIAVVSCLHLVFQTEKQKAKKNIYLIINILVVVVAAIGLSRAFIIVFAVWIFLTLFLQRDAKRMFLSIIIACVAFAVFINVFPEVYEGITVRFKEEDLSGGNGRVRLILEHYNTWKGSAGTLLFGSGLYNNNTHAAPLLYLFGIGIVGMMILISWFVSMINTIKTVSVKKRFMNIVPFICTFVMFSTIPAAGSMNYTLPLIISLFPMGGGILNYEQKS